MNPILIPLQILLVSIDILISLVSFGWINVIRKWINDEKNAKILRTVPVGDDPSHRVNANYKDHKVTKPLNGSSTLYEMATFAVKNYGSNVCTRKRHFIGWKSPKVKEFDPTIIHEMTYKEAGEKAHKFGAALRANGCVPSPPKTTLQKVTIPCRIAIFENTCPEWMISALGAQSQSIGITTVYATLGIDAVIEAINDSLVPVIVCNKTNVKYLVEKSKQMPSLKAIVYTNDLVPPNDDIEIPSNTTGSNLNIYSFDEFVNSGNTDKYPPTPPTPKTTAVIMYTSGSTGKPKGVVMTHEQGVAAAGATEGMIPIKESDQYLAYLPLAHILELGMELAVLSKGVTLNYADPKSLASTGSYPKGALEVYHPTHMVAVPKIWSVIQKGILAKVALTSPVAQCIVLTAFQWRAVAMKIGLDTPLFNKLVFKKFKDGVGGNLSWALSGGGPLSGDVQEFIRVAFDVPLIQGYGLTETVAGLAIQDTHDDRPNVAGVIIPSVEVKVVSTPEICDKGGMPYMSSDRRDVDGNLVWGRGEIWVRGGNITSGYYMMEDKSKEVYTEDGWFKTGDIGQFLEDGSIRIVDRKKNLVKLRSGEYIALERMEAVYGNSIFVDAIAGGVCCYGDGGMDRPVAMMQINKTEAMSWAKANGVEFKDFDKLLHSNELYSAVIESMKKEHAMSDLSPIEKLQAVVMLDSPWTPENGCLTAANKLQRRVVADTFSKELEVIKKKGVF